MDGTAALRTTAAYAVTGLLGVALVTGLLWPWLASPGRTGILAAAGVAWSVQVVAFGGLVASRRRTNRFLLVWGAGTVVRMALVLLAALVVIRVPALPPLATLLALAGFLFGLLLLEPVFFRKALEGPTGDGRNRTVIR